MKYRQTLTRASISRVATARYLLREIEHAKRVTGEVAVEASDKVHVEHIYPQTPSSAKWSNYTQMINRIGNLTLLSKRLNIGIKNADFAIKKQDAYEASDILITKELAELDAWDANAVVNRQRELSQSVGNIWRFPGETPPETMKATSRAEPLLADATQADATTEGVSIDVGAPSTGSRDVEIDQLPEVPTG
jgi:hypothetical protein